MYIPNRLFSNSVQQFRKRKDTMLSREQHFVTNQLSQDAANAPHIDGLAVALWVQHDLRSAVPTCGHVFCEETRVIHVGIRHPCQAEIADLRRKRRKTVWKCIREIMWRIVFINSRWNKWTAYRWTFALISIWNNGLQDYRFKRQLAYDKILFPQIQKKIFLVFSS